MISVLHCDVHGSDVVLGELDVVGYAPNPASTGLVYRCPLCGGLAEVRAGAAGPHHEGRAASAPVSGGANRR